MEKNQTNNDRNQDVKNWKSLSGKVVLNLLRSFDLIIRPK